jgi:polysaccharide deacetylase family protein (PEP-CTERM system associated)
MQGGLEDSEPSSFQASKPPNLIASQPQAERRPKATFFVLGWIAEKLPHLVREIHSQGHEVASHGCNHQLPDQLSADELKQDLTDSKKLLEDITGAEVVGYRAPSFAVNDGVLKTIEDCDYHYDSSYNSFGLHGRYGKISLNGTGRMGIAHRLSENFFELPVSNLRLGGRVIPMGGGAYFRLTPGPLFRRSVKSILDKEGAYLFYLHPWEIDPDQPRVRRAGSGARFKHYTNLGRTESGLVKMRKRFSHCRFITCSEYLERVNKKTI